MREVESFQDYIEILDTVNGIFVNSDNRDWAGVANCFNAEVLLDYTSMTGGEPAHLTPAEIVESWKGLLPGFASTQHSISNHKIEIMGDSAECFSYGTALHYLPNPSGQNLWTVVGTYNHSLVKTEQGWKVNFMRFNLKFIEGNTDLPRLAQAAVQGNKKS